MIIVFVRFSLPANCNRAAIAQDFVNISAMFHDIPGLLRKYFILAEDQPVAGGIYLWESREAAAAFYNDNFKLIIKERYGTIPEITFFDCPIVVDNQLNDEFCSLAA